MAKNCLRYKNKITFSPLFNIVESRYETSPVVEGKVENKLRPITYAEWFFRA